MPNGTDFPTGDVDETHLRNIREKYNLPDNIQDNIPVLLFVGRMMWYKGIGLTLEALEILDKKGFDFRMLFVGDGEDLIKAKKIVMNMKLNDKVHFAGRVNDREELRAYYTAADLFILPSVYDNAPLVVQEAAACGCPSLVVHGSSAAEIIEDGVNGYHSGQTPPGIADKIIEIWNDKLTLQRVSKEAVEELYTPWSKVADISMARYKVIKEIFDKKMKINRIKVLKKRVKALNSLNLKHPRKWD
jgi:glycosyltransferase involved in cell wall biosynthesis